MHELIVHICNCNCLLEIFEEIHKYTLSSLNVTCNDRGGGRSNRYTYTELSLANSQKG